MLWASELLGENLILPIDDTDDDGSFPQFQRLLYGLSQSSLDIFADDQSVHHRFNIMFQGLFQIHFLFRDVHNDSVNPCSDISGFLDGLKNLFVLSLFPFDHGRQHMDSCPFRKLHDLIHHLVHTLRRDLPVADGTVGNTEPRIEKSQIIIDLCDGPHRGSRIFRSGFLINGNGRAESFYGLHIRFVHLAKKLPCIGRKGLHISSLTLRIKSVKSQRGLA